VDTRAGAGLVSDWRDQVAADAETWIGTPYVPKARIKGVGVDCGALLYEVYCPYFGPFAQYPNYTADWSLHEASDEKYLEFIKPYTVEVRAPIKGGISLFHMGLRYAHAAIFVGDNQYVHAWGRLRAGSVTKSPLRVMQWLGRGHPIKHFDVVQP
jgi:cell wall-associated NlpC family hydrolase